MKGSEESQSRWRDGRGFEVSGTSNPELRTSLRAFLFEDFPLRLKPVIKSTLAGALFVDLAGSRRDPRVEIFRQGRCGRIGLRAAGRFLARRLQCGWFIRIQGFHPMSPILNQVRDARLSSPWGEVKDRVEDVVVAFVLTRTWFIRMLTRHLRPGPAAGVDTGKPWEGRMHRPALGERIRPRRNATACSRVNVWSRWKRQPRADRLLLICV